MSESEILIFDTEKKQTGRKPKEVWNFFISIGEKKDGHQGCKCMYCQWSQTRGEPNIMETHLAINCYKAPGDVKEKFLFLVKTRDAVVSNNKKRKVGGGNQQLITKYGEVDTIEPLKQSICDHAVTKFFICCGISFRIVEYPFFIDMVKSLCVGYDPPTAEKITNDFMYTELANVVVDQRLLLEKSKNLTLGNKINKANYYSNFNKFTNYYICLN